MRQPDRYPHGTRSRYVVAECRCDECRRANTVYQYARYRRGQPRRPYRSVPEKLAALLSSTPPLLSIQHPACGNVHQLLLQSGPEIPFKPNGALGSYLGRFKCGVGLTHVYTRDRRGSN